MRMLVSTILVMICCAALCGEDVWDSIKTPAIAQEDIGELVDKSRVYFLSYPVDNELQQAVLKITSDTADPLRQLVATSVLAPASMGLKPMTNWSGMSKFALDHPAQLPLDWSVRMRLFTEWRRDALRAELAGMPLNERIQSIHGKLFMLRMEKSELYNIIMTKWRQLSQSKLQEFLDASGKKFAQKVAILPLDVARQEVFLRWLTVEINDILGSDSTPGQVQPFQPDTGHKGGGDTKQSGRSEPGMNLHDNSNWQAPVFPGHEDAEHLPQELEVITYRYLISENQSLIVNDTVSGLLIWLKNNPNHPLAPSAYALMANALYCIDYADLDRQIAGRSCRDLLELAQSNAIPQGEDFASWMIVYDSALMGGLPHHHLRAIAYMAAPVDALAVRKRPIPAPLDYFVTGTTVGKQGFTAKKRLYSLTAQELQTCAESYYNRRLAERREAAAASYVRIFQGQPEALETAIRFMPMYDPLVILARDALTRHRVGRIDRGVKVSMESIERGSTTGAPVQGAEEAP